MTSISPNPYRFSPPAPTAASPRARVDDRIGAAAAAGEISRTDQTALSSALDSIDTSLAATKGSVGSAASMQDKIGSLIADQVSAGTLNEDQATELKGFLTPAPAGARGPGGPPPPPADEAETGTTAKVGTASDKLDTMDRLLDKLRVAFSSGNPYGAGGSTVSTTTMGVVLDKRA